MGIVQIFSKRKKNLAPSGAPERFVSLPSPFRVQISHLLEEAIGEYDPEADYGYSRSNNRIWSFLHDTLAHEYGVDHLRDSEDDPKDACISFLRNAEPNQALDIIEYGFRIIDTVMRKADHEEGLERYGATLSADRAIEELNYRFREHGIGYQYVKGLLCRVDVEFLHEEVTKPAIDLLSDEKFVGAAQEFSSAHQHYRHGEYKETINAAGKALESTLRSICSELGWEYGDKARASTLLKIVFEKGLVPSYLQSEFESLKSLLDSGVPTVRNQSTASHGQGEEIVSVPDHLAAFALHMTASNIVFLGRCLREYRRIAAGSKAASA